MKKEYLIGLLVLAVITVGGFFMTRGQNTYQSTNNTPSLTENFEAGENTVIYINSGYSPSELTVTTGTNVTFINQSDFPVWTASDPHPLHTDYPDFDSRRGMEKGEIYSYTFRETGTYQYHNHLAPQHPGTITVK